MFDVGTIDEQITIEISAFNDIETIDEDSHGLYCTDTLQTPKLVTLYWLWTQGVGDGVSVGVGVTVGQGSDNTLV